MATLYICTFKVEQKFRVKKIFYTQVKNILYLRISFSYHIVSRSTVLNLYSSVLASLPVCHFLLSFMFSGFGRGEEGESFTSEARISS